MHPLCSEVLNTSAPSPRSSRQTAATGSTACCTPSHLCTILTTCCSVIHRFYHDFVQEEQKHDAQITGSGKSKIRNKLGLVRGEGRTGLSLVFVLDDRPIRLRKQICTVGVVDCRTKYGLRPYCPNRASPSLDMCSVGLRICIFL